MDESELARGSQLVVGDEPYFFLSYAHAFRANEPGAEDHDSWVFKLFNDLTHHIGQITGLPPSKVGFIDRELRSGDEWPWYLSRNLATSRVFVPLYSRRFFQSQHCGKEWTAYRNRVHNGSGHPNGQIKSIIPALWAPVRTDQYPLAAQSIHFDPREFGSVYADYGFYAIMKLNRFRDEYDFTVLELARRIVQIAEETEVPPGPEMDYGLLSSAWEEGSPKEMAGDKRLRVIIAAPHLAGLPVGRNRQYYGLKAADWAPYKPDSVQPLAQYAVVLARYLSYRPEISDIYEQADELLSEDGPGSGPAVVLIDPWEAAEPRCRQILARLDELNKPWIQPVVVWNRKDNEMTGSERELRAALEMALPITLRDRLRPTALPAARGIPSIEDVTGVLGDCMRHAARQYLKYAQGRQTGETSGDPNQEAGLRAVPPPPQEREDV